MVERTLQLNNVFASLADETRRDILLLVSTKALSISQIANHYKLTYGAISKHILVLEHAKLVVKKHRGKERLVHIAPDALSEAEDYLKSYRQEWESRLDSLEIYISKNKEQ